MMAPTEVLARQHYDNLIELIKEHNINVNPVVLVGSMTAKEKREAYKVIESGDADIIIGTHALIQEKVNYNNLTMVVTDEQHRFGVNQRRDLSDKGNNPHILVMSATPIPRTLAIIVYGDLDISVIDELPAERLPIKNCVVDDGRIYCCHCDRYVCDHKNCQTSGWCRKLSWNIVKRCPESDSEKRSCGTKG